MRKSIKVLSVIAIVSMVLLSACSSNPSSKESTSPSTSTSPEKAAKPPVELVIWGVPANNFPDSEKVTPEDKAIYAYIQKKMEEVSPGIKLTYVDKGWGDTLRQSVMLATMGGNAPDIGYGEDFIPEFAKNNALLEIPADAVKDLAPGALAGGVYQGKNYAVSLMTGVFSLIYNKDVLKKAGLDPNQPPKTWDEWLAMSQKITAAGAGKYYGSAVQNMQLGGAFRIAPLMRQLGGDFTNADGSKVTFNSAENVKALTFLQKLALTGPKGMSTMTDEGALYNMIHHGEIAFGIGGPWHLSWAKTEGCNCGYAPLPLPEGGKNANVIVGNTLWYGLKSTKHSEEVIEYLKLIASPELQDMFALESGRLPSNVKAGQNPDLIAKYPDMKVFSEIVANEPSTPLPSYQKNGPKVWEAWYKAQDEIFISNTPVDKALAEAQKSAEELLK